MRQSGPARTLAAAPKLAAPCYLSAALLDVQLADGAAFAIAYMLAERGLPFAFHSGHSNVAALQAEWAVDVVAKPPQPVMIVHVMAKPASLGVGPCSRDDMGEPTSACGVLLAIATG